MADSAPATRKLLLQLQAQVVSRAPDLNFIIDRTDEEPLSIEEMPAAIAKLLVFQIAQGPEQGQSVCRGVFHVECQSGNTAISGIDTINQTSIAQIVAAIHSDRTLGGMVEDIEERSGDASESAGADIGAAVLLIDATWHTPRGDLFTIVGQGGQLF